MIPDHGISSVSQIARNKHYNEDLELYYDEVRTRSHRRLALGIILLLLVVSKTTNLPCEFTKESCVKFNSEIVAYFEAKVAKLLCKSSGTINTRTSPYYPIGNDRVESFNCTLLNMLETVTNTPSQTGNLTPLPSVVYIWTASSEFGTYRLCEQRRSRRACASAQSRQNLRHSLIQAVSQEEPSDRKPDPRPL